MFAELLSNPVFTGVLGGSLVAGGLYALKAVPGRAWEFVMWRFSTEVVVFNEDPAFEMVSEWLASLEYAKRARRLRLTSQYSDDERRDAIKVSPGIGTHVIWWRGHPVLVTRNVPKDGNQAGSYRRREDITIQTLGGSPDRAYEIIENIVSGQDGPSSRYVNVYLYRDGWRLACRKQKRALDSVVIPAAQRRAIVRDIEQFKVSRDWYAARGIPYRRGMLFQGPPGVGKTSLVFALASHFAMRIYALNLGSLKNDNELIEAVTSVPENALLLIEDIDAAQRDRSKTIGEGEKPENVVTMSGLLNAIDGVFSRDGRILVMTTNHPEKLDPAMTRAGRADRIETIGELGPTEARVMCRQFLGADGESFAARVETPIRAAELQRILLAASEVEAQPELSLDLEVKRCA